MKINIQRPKKILHDTKRLVNDYNEIDRSYTEDAYREYRGGCESYEDPADYIRKPIRGVIIA